MTRVKRGVIAHKRREKLLKYAKGYHWGRKSKEKQAREALLHAWSYAFHGRKLRKRDARKLWQIKIGIATKNQGLSYNKFISELKKKTIQLDRKILAELAEKRPTAFAKVVETAH